MKNKSDDSNNDDSDIKGNVVGMDKEEIDELFDEINIENYE